jgi:hypothetical protein
MGDFDDDEEATPTNPDGGRILVSSRAGAALDGPVPDEVFTEGGTARVHIDPALMPEVASVINAERVTERNHVIGAFVDVLIGDGTAPPAAVALSRRVLALLAQRRKEALRKTLLGPGNK